MIPRALRLLLVVSIAGTGCGRINFDVDGGDAGTSVDAGSDGDANLADDPDAELAADVVVSPTTGLTTSETGTTATFSVVLTRAPSADVSIAFESSNTLEATIAPTSLTFTSANWMSAQSITITGVDDTVADGNQLTTIASAAATSADLAFDGINPDDVSVINLDDESAQIVATPSSGLTTTELGGSASFDVTLSTLPAASVMVDVTVSDLSEGSTSTTTLTFDTLNWDSSQTVTVTGVDDAIIDGPQAYEVILHATSADPLYAALADTRVSLTNTDDETAGVTVIPTSGLGTSEAGTTATFTVVLDSRPDADVSISLVSSNLDEGTVSPASLTFTPIDWDTPQTVIVTGVDDSIADGDIVFFVVSGATTSTDPNYTSLPVPDVSVSNHDDDVVGLIAAPSTGLVTSEAGGTATFDVVLASEPVGDVELSITSTDLSEGTVSPATLSFTALDWNMSRTITITGVDDALDDGAISYEVVGHVTSSADVNYAATSDVRVAVSNADDETAGVTVNPSSGLFTSEAGATATFTVVLTSEPSNDVTIPLSSNRTDEGTVSPASVTFTNANWSTPQSVTITGVNDHRLDGDFLYAIVTGASTSMDSNYNGIDPVDVGVTNRAFPTQQALITPEVATPLQFFGFALSMSADGSTLAVGSTQEDSPSSGINGDPNSSAALGSGAVYVFVRTGSTWTQQAYIKASNTGATDEFGTAVSISADGNTLVVTAQYEDSASTGVNGLEADESSSDTGAAYIFSRSGTTWMQQAYIKSSATTASDQFGYSAAISGDGDTVVICATGEDSMATGIDGDDADNSVGQSGAAYVFTRSAGIWSQQAYVKASNTESGDAFGYSSSLSHDGNTLAVSSRLEDSAATGIGGDQASNAVGDSGAVYLFSRTGATWTQSAYIKASLVYSTLWFGEEVELSADGNTLGVSALGDRSASTGVNGDQTSSGLGQAGGAYIFVRSGMTWSQQAYVKATNTTASDRYGTDIALSADGSTLAIGAIGEDSAATGINGDQASNGTPNSGAVYVYTRDGTTWSHQLYVKPSDPTPAAYFGWAADLSADGNMLIASAVFRASGSIYTYVGD